MLDVGFRVDAGAKMGGGHLVRCSALAAAMMERRWKTTLHGSEETIRLAKDMEGFSGRSPLVASKVTDPAALSSDHDLIVIDHYGIDRDYEAQLQSREQSVLVISDQADRPHAADILVDQNLSVKASDYRDLVPPECIVLTGSDFVMLRPAFRRQPRLAEPKPRRPAHHLLITFGASDPHDLTGSVLTMLRNAVPEHWKIRVVLGPSYDKAKAVEELARNWPALQIERAPADLLASMRWADAAIAALGGTLWELCYLGVPFAVLTADAKSSTTARTLAQRSVAIDLGSIGALSSETLGKSIGALMNDAALRGALASNALHLVEGRGADLICDAIERRLCAK